MSGPKEDRYQLLKATGVNLSPVILLRDAAPGAVTTLLDRLTAGEPDVVATTDDGVRHRMWTCPATADERVPRRAMSARCWRCSVAAR